MTLVKLIAMRILAELKVKADGAYKDMNDWLGARFLKEMERFVRAAVDQDGDRKRQKKNTETCFASCGSICRFGRLCVCISLVDNAL